MGRKIPFIKKETFDKKTNTVVSQIEEKVWDDDKTKALEDELTAATHRMLNKRKPGMTVLVDEETGLRWYRPARDGKTHNTKKFTTDKEGKVTKFEYKGKEHLKNMTISFRGTPSSVDDLRVGYLLMNK